MSLQDLRVKRRTPTHIVTATAGPRMAEGIALCHRNAAARLSLTCRESRVRGPTSFRRVWQSSDRPESKRIHLGFRWHHRRATTAVMCTPTLDAQRTARGTSRPPKFKRESAAAVASEVHRPGTTPPSGSTCHGECRATSSRPRHRWAHGRGRSPSLLCDDSAAAFSRLTMPPATHTEE